MSLLWIVSAHSVLTEVCANGDTFARAEVTDGRNICKLILRHHFRSMSV